MNWRGRHGPLRLPDSGSAPILKLQAMVECTESLLKKTGACGHGSTARLRLEVASHSLDERKKANSIMQGGGHAKFNPILGRSLSRPHRIRSRKFGKKRHGWHESVSRHASEQKNALVSWLECAATISV